MKQGSICKDHIFHNMNIVKDFDIITINIFNVVVLVPIFFMTYVSSSTVDYVKIFLEWMSDSIAKFFEHTRDNAFYLKSTLFKLCANVLRHHIKYYNLEFMQLNADMLLF